ncbi:hypothetical protein VI817_004360 [Penicillium citrinum]|nr:hypothetical protein VI817_004360 [Penicillium citrinum]
MYLSTIRPREIKDQKVAKLRKQIQELNIKRKTPERLLNNAKKDLFRLYAERDSLKGEKERLKMEKAAKETWWLYIYSFLPGKAAEFTQMSRRQESAISTMAGIQRTKERDIDLKTKFVRTLEERIRSISSGEDKNKTEIRKVEEDYREKMLQQEQEIKLTELRKKSEQAFYARPSTQTHFREEYSHFQGTSAWDF